MVWIFGGGYSTGSGDSLQTRGDQLVRTFGDVVVITFNYRLGVFGWLGSESLRRYTFEKTGLNTTGNLGLLDQVELLRWVQRHAESFGGDPSRVLLFGESAGAGAVSAHLTSTLSRGLFHRAVMQSGGFNEWVAMPMKHAEDNFAGMAAAMRDLRNAPWWRGRKYACGDQVGDLECLVESKIPGALLLDVMESQDEYLRNSSDENGMQQCHWGPTIDGVLLQEHPFHSLQRGDWHPVPVVIGMNRDDGTEFVDGCRNGEDHNGRPTCRMSPHLYDELIAYFRDKSRIDDPKCFREPMFRLWLGLNWGSENVDALAKLYSTTSGGFRTNFWAAEHLVGDYVMACTQRRAAALMAEAAPVFQYEFARVPTEAPFRSPWHLAPVDDGFGACHGCEIPFVFNRNDSKEFGITGDGELQLGLFMSSYWTNFAWSGDPNDRGGRWTAEARTPSRWPRAGASPPSAASLLLNASAAAADLRVIEGRGARCAAFWDGFFERAGWFAKDASRQGVAPASWLRRRPPRRQGSARSSGMAGSGDICAREALGATLLV